VYDDLNPFEDGITTVDVTIEMKDIQIEVCEATDFDGTTVEIDCAELDDEDEEEGKRRKRRFFRKAWEKTKRFVKTVTRPIVKVVLKFTPPIIKDNIKKVVAMSRNIKNNLKKTLDSVTGGLISKVENVATGLVDKVNDLGNAALNFLLNKLECGTGGFGKVAGPALKLLKDKVTDKNPMKSTGMGFVPSVVENIGNSKFKLQSWMGSLPEKVRELPLSMIAIPGTHDSATYMMRMDMVYSPDSPLLEKIRASPVLVNMIPARPITAAWGRAVKQTTYQQLLMGIRYFDYRPMAHTGRHAGDTSSWNAHGLYATRMSHEFGQIKLFLAKFPSEVVILDLNGYWWKLTNAHYQTLETEIQTLLGSMLCKPVSLESMTYNSIQNVQKCNVIVRYDTSSASEGGGVENPTLPDFAFDDTHILSTWHDTADAEIDPCVEDDVSDLYGMLDKDINAKSYSARKYAFHVAQGLWTPDFDAIWKGMLYKSKPSLYHWTKDQYRQGGPFEKWLKKVKTCKSRKECCAELSGYANIIIRDFPTVSFGIEVVNKNFNWADADELDCEQAKIQAEIDEAQAALDKALADIASATTPEEAEKAREQAKKAIELAEKYKLEAAAAQAAEAENQALAKKEAIRIAEEEAAKKAAEEAARKAAEEAAAEAERLRLEAERQKAEAEARAAAALAATRTISAVESNMRDILNRGISNNWSAGSISDTLQEAIAARLGQSVQCFVCLDCSYAYTGNAYWVRPSNGDASIAVCGKHVSRDISASYFDGICDDAVEECKGDGKSCVRDEVKDAINNNYNMCGGHNYGLLVSDDKTAYNGYTGSVKRVEGDYIFFPRVQCTIICGGY